MYNIFFFFISPSQINPRIKLNNMNLYLDSAESQLFLKIQGFNNCMLGNQCYFLFDGPIELSSFYFAIYFLNVTQNFVLQQNIYVQHLRESSKSALTK